MRRACDNDPMAIRMRATAATASSETSICTRETPFPSWNTWRVLAAARRRDEDPAFLSTSMGTAQQQQQQTRTIILQRQQRRIRRPDGVPPRSVLRRFVGGVPGPPRRLHSNESAPRHRRAAPLVGTATQQAQTTTTLPQHIKLETYTVSCGVHPQLCQRHAATAASGVEPLPLVVLYAPSIIIHQ